PLTSLSRTVLSLPGHANASIEVSALQECRIAHVMIQSRQDPFTSSISPEVFLITYHNKQGTRCSKSNIASDTTACFAIVRQLPVRRMTRQDRRSVFTASFVPDSSTGHYIIAVQV
ncbi:MAG: hypothetical protein P4L87_23215, partial [Formivibrio sp.]|nr:hypothetical protein [Formivibrio sp.]